MNKGSRSPVVGIDALGRATRAVPEKTDLKDNRQIGLFYFLWLSENNKKLYNISEITDADPDAGYKPDDPMWGNIGDYHYWGEPFYGYYAMTDEWVVRRHMKLIMEAGIDFLFFDTTNAVVYEPVCHIVMRVLQEYHDEGHAIPQVMFYTNTASGQTVRRIYDEFYKPGLYRDTWYLWDGKPVIIAIPEECDEECRKYFTIKLSQWPNEATKQGGWPWMDFEKPQRVFENLLGEPESINVSVAQHPQIRFGDSVMYGETTNCGRAWHDGANDRGKDAYIQGYNFAEQFERALETDPPVVLITGWNEWIAGRWQGTPERPILFVDCANYEFSRDIEMMRGGYFDNYYMQLIKYTALYKGGIGQEKTVSDVKCHYEGFSDGNIPRNCHGWTPEIYYSDDSAVYSLRGIDVSRTEDEITFDIHADNIKEGDEKLFSLFLSKGERAGFDYVISGDTLLKISRADAAPTVSRECDVLTDTAPAGKAAVKVSSDCVSFTVRINDLGLEKNEIWFKAANSRRPYRKIDDLYDNGDVLPMGRPCFVYRW